MKPLLFTLVSLAVAMNPYQAQKAALDPPLMCGHAYRWAGRFCVDFDTVPGQFYDECHFVRAYTTAAAHGASAAGTSRGPRLHARKHANVCPQRHRCKELLEQGPLPSIVCEPVPENSPSTFTDRSDRLAAPAPAAVAPAVVLGSKHRQPEPVWRPVAAIAPASGTKRKEIDVGVGFMLGSRGDWVASDASSSTTIRARPISRPEPSSPPPHQIRPRPAAPTTDFEPVTRPTETDFTVEANVCVSPTSDPSCADELFMAAAAFLHSSRPSAASAAGVHQPQPAVSQDIGWTDDEWLALLDDADIGRSAK